MAPQRRTGNIGSTPAEKEAVTFAIAIGCFELTNFVRLNVAYLRRSFSFATPIVLYDAPSEQSNAIREIAMECGCGYFCERVNRGHFSGDIQAAVTAVALARQYGRDVGLKINQRTILLDPEAPARLARDFQTWSDVTLVSPGRYPEASILDPLSRFHARFPCAVDVLAFRARDWDPALIAERYTRQWKESPSKYGAYSEVFWGNESQRLGPAHVKADWLTAHTPGEPFNYLRKIQNTEADYNAAALAIGLKAGRFDTAEWKMKKRGAYQPTPRA